MMTLSLRARILTLVAGFVVMALAIMLFGLATLADYDRMMTDYGRAYENAYMGERLNHLMTSSLMESRGLYLSNAPAEDQAYIRNIEDDLAQTDAILEQWRAEKVATPDIGFDRLAARVHAFVQVRYGILRVTRQSKTAGRALGLAYKPQRQALQADIDRMVQQTRQTLAAARARGEAYRRQRTVTFVVATLIWIGVTTLLTLWVVSHFITREIARIRVEDEKREKLLKQLVETNTDLERFAYVASHDMLEPVRMVNIYSQMVAEDYRSVLDESGRKYLHIISASAARMHAMVQDLLHYSRLPHDHDRHEPVDLNAELDCVRANFGRLINDSGARIEADALPQVQANPVQVQRLLGNLVANAIKYQPEGQVPIVRIDAVDRGDMWEIAVADNGIGIDPQFATQVFEPFRRLHTWDQYEGSGMGLAICRKIVERHGGRIRIDPQPGEGTRIVFTLPKVVPVPQTGEVRTAA
jgi:signal transduction histidine kinase